MARLNNGFLGNASGKIGNVVFAKWRDINTARQYQPDVHDANTPAQKKQRSRMVALLQFLKPLNKSFIKLFNASLAKGSTPWAVAIKENMPGVSPDGCFPLQNLRLGNPNLPPCTIVETIYNPFIDQTSFKYRPVHTHYPTNPFPYVAASVLGKYPSENGIHEFDVRHPMCFLPPGHFFCSIYTETQEWAFDNWWSGGMFWMMFFDTYDMDKFYDPNDGLSGPSYFQPVSIIDGFNTKIKENPVPKEAITWEYQTIEKKNFLVFNIDYKKIHIKNPKDYFIRFWKIALGDGSVQQFDAVDWDMSMKSYKAELINSVARKATTVLYSVYKKSGEQVACFNRFYIDKNCEGKVLPYFDQLFDTSYSHPASFVLPGTQCGFCGNINELFSDFIELWEQGVIHNGDDPAPAKEVLLSRSESPNGIVDVKDFAHGEGDIFYFNENTKAKLETKPDTGYQFSRWFGADAADIVKTSDNSYELVMSKDRSIAAEFKSIK